MTANDWISKLQLEKHPEGGYYKEVYRSPLSAGNRKLYTSIYFLLPSDEVSHFHRIQSDEIWYHHDGAPIVIHEIDTQGKLSSTQLGKTEACVLSHCVNAKHIFGATVSEPNTFSLVSCMVSPGFEFDDFKLFSKQELLDLYPQHQAIIQILT